MDAAVHLRRLLRQLAGADLAEHLFELLRAPLPHTAGHHGHAAEAVQAAQVQEALMLQAIEVLANLAEDGEEGGRPHGWLLTTCWMD